MKILSKQKGFAPIVIVLAIALAGLGSVGTAAAANNSTPGDPLFGLDTALEQIQVNLAGNDVVKAKVRLEIANERLEELRVLAETERDVDDAVTGAQLAINNATNDLTNVQTKVKEHKITLTSTDLQALLTELQNVLSTHQGLVRRVEIKIKDGEVRAKVKLFGQEASKAAKLLDNDLDDLEDDGELNDSDEDKNDEDDNEDEERKPGGSPRPSGSINQGSDDDDDSSSDSGTNGGDDD